MLYSTAFPNAYNDFMQNVIKPRDDRILKAVVDEEMKKAEAIVDIHSPGEWLMKEREEMGPEKAAEVYPEERDPK